MKRVMAMALIGVFAAGCATSAPPPPSVYVTPLKGQTGEQQLRDQNDCQAIAKGQTGYDPATETAKGAGVGGGGEGRGEGRGGRRDRRRGGRRRLPVQQEQGRVQPGVRELHDRARL